MYIILKKGSFCDIVWSDPSKDVDLWALNDRGAGYVFGETVCTKFCELNNLKMICRAH